MTTKCGKAVEKFVKKSAQKSWMKNVEKLHLVNVLHDLCIKVDFSHSFSQLVLTCKKYVLNLLDGSFYTFSTDTTNTTINIRKV